MRGLTQAEREYLDMVSDDFDPSWLPMSQALIARGLVRVERTPWAVTYQNTDLGRLALRVCPVGEP